MVLPSRSIPKGFTLIEMMIIMGMVAVLAGSYLFLDVNTFRGDAFRSERGTLMTLLQVARADALNNINEHSHGVAIHPGGYDGYVVFEGSSYATRVAARDQQLAASYGATIAGPSEVVFGQLSGDSNFAGDITLTDPTRGMSTKISINYEGGIW